MSKHFSISMNEETLAISNPIYLFAIWQQLWKLKGKKGRRFQIRSFHKLSLKLKILFSLPPPPPDLYSKELDSSQWQNNIRCKGAPQMTGIVSIKSTCGMEAAHFAWPAGGPRPRKARAASSHGSSKNIFCSLLPWHIYFVKKSDTLIVLSLGSWKKCFYQFS